MPTNGKDTVTVHMRNMVDTNSAASECFLSSALSPPFQYPRVKFHFGKRHRYVSMWEAREKKGEMEQKGKQKVKHVEIYAEKNNNY